MPELIRSVVSRARTYFHDRRQSPRLNVRLGFRLSIPRPLNVNGSNKPRHFLIGHTRDISANGLALLVPHAHLNGRHLAADGCSLDVRLDLGNDATIQMLVVPERYEHLDEGESGCAYLIGAKIVKIDEADQNRYLSYIRQGLATV
jgi:PilZ domain